MKNDNMKTTFNDVLKECKNEPNFAISPGCSTESKGFFTCLRVDRDTVPDGWFVYEIMHGDGGGLCVVKEHVFVNHAGTFITQTKITMNKDGEHNLQSRGGYTFL